MSKRSLIIGMGIGQLYKTVLEKLGHEVITVDKDITKGASMPSIDAAILLYGSFDTVHICTPNFTHFEIAAKIAPHAKIVFVEKPGVADSNSWNILLETFKYTRFMMVKNNMWRSNIADLKASADQAKTVNIRWLRKNCIPSPGSWFTTRKFAFGGVSRDLMPHLLSLYVAMNPDWRKEAVTGRHSLQCWNLESIDSTEYGTVNPLGTYDVDDRCHMHFSNKWMLLADWRTTDKDDSSIEFIMQDNTVERFELGWCPEDAYQSMIKDAIDHIDDHEFWTTQYAIDSWIHTMIEKL
jgi:predicted dehydrogenase